MNFVHIAHAISYGDGASGQVIAMDKMFREMGLDSCIYAGKFDPKLGAGIKLFDEYRYKSGDIPIFHFSTGTSFVNKILQLPIPIVLYYHNITPAEHFAGIAWGSYFSARKGRRQLLQLREKTAFAWAASEYSRQELAEYGFRQTSVMPIIVDFTEYESVGQDATIVDRFRDGKINILFVGRVTPHKKQEDIIRVLFYYKRFIDSNVRLVLVGGQKESYVSGLRSLIGELGLENDVVFSGKVSFEELCTYYKVADVFVCMSEHEGFCIPLVEASYFDLPVFAFSAAAIPFTMGNSGVLFERKDYPVVAEAIRLLAGDSQTRQKIISAQRKRVADFGVEKIRQGVEKDLTAIKNLLLW
ncbi:MAG: hypothetical protein H6Q73_1749 [Firmicutes bacterium]|nr:hypothetical protein [Bacillota bacterium]